MEKFLNILSVIILPVQILNLIGLPIAVVWLLILGNWQVIALAVIFLLMAKFILALLFLIPGLIMMPLAALTENKNMKFLQYPLVLISSLIHAAIITIWGLFIIITFSNYSTDNNIIPLLILTFCTAGGLIASMAADEPKDSASHTYNFFFQLGYFCTILIILFFNITILTCAIIIFCFMLIPVFLNLWIFHEETLAENRFTL